MLKKVYTSVAIAIAAGIVLCGVAGAAKRCVARYDLPDPYVKKCLVRYDLPDPYAKKCLVRYDLPDPMSVFIHA